MAQPISYGYGRISTSEDRQVYSRDAQEFAVQHAYELIQDKCQWGGFFFDPDTSGSTNLFDRAAGRELNMRLEKGDHLFIAKVDRAFRNHRDQVCSVEALDMRGILLHFLDLGVDTSTDTGRFMLNIMGAAAEMERSRIKGRIKDAFAAKRRRGLPMGHSAPIGWSIDGKKRSALYIPDYEERKVCEEIYELRKNRNAFWTAVQLNKEKRPLLARHRLRKKNLCGWKGDWSIHWIEQARKAFMLNFPCDQIDTRLRWLSESGLLRRECAS